MTFSEFIPLTAAIVNLALSLFVLTRDLNSTINRVYVLWGGSITIWNLGTYFMFRVDNAAEALFWARVLQLGVIFLPITLYHLCVLVARIPAKKSLWFFYSLHGVMALTNLTTDWFVADVRDAGYAFYSKAAPLFWIFIASYVFLTWRTLYLLFKKLRDLPPLHHTRVKSLLLADATLIFFGNNDILPILGIYHYPLTQWQIFPFGSAAAIFYGIMVGYSVLQHHLLDVHITMGKLAAHFVRLLFLFLFGLLFLLLLSSFFPQHFNLVSFLSALGVVLASGIVASVYFPRLFGRGEDALERRILGDRFEYHAQVQNLIQTMRASPEPENLTEQLYELLAKTVRVQSYHVVLLDETTRRFRLFHSHPLHSDAEVSDWQTESPVLQFFQQTQASYLSCKVEYQTTRDSALERQAREQLKLFEPEFCFPFFAGRELVGMMLLGPKQSGDLFTPHDLRLLTELAHNLGLLLNQIRLRNQLQVVHEQDLLGRMSRGLAHDLNNLLTPVQTLLQLFEAATPGRDTINELLPMALRNIETVRSYVNEALFFSRASTLQAKPACLFETARAAATLVQPAAQGKGITLTVQDGPETIIEMDAVLIKRLLCNLLSNAIDASPAGSEISIRLSQLPKTEVSRDWYRVQVIDPGEGISPENLKRVFTPYFTTKNTGDGKRGFGLGLAIARKIVHLHGGNLSISSRERRGTTVQVDLPSRQSTLTTQSAGGTLAKVAA